MLIPVGAKLDVSSQAMTPRSIPAGSFLEWTEDSPEGKTAISYGVTSWHPELHIVSALIQYSENPNGRFSARVENSGGSPLSIRFSWVLLEGS